MGGVGLSLSIRAKLGLSSPRAAASRSQAAACPATGSAESAGPHTGHAFGCAWKRRSAGFSYSARHSSHMVKPTIVVYGRSYGMSRMMVYRGPQLVQLVKAYPNRRLRGSVQSARHWAHVAMCGEISANL